MRTRSLTMLPKEEKILGYSLSKVFDKPFIVTNGMLVQCEVTDGTYTPIEIISIQKLISYLKNEEKLEMEKDKLDSFELRSNSFSRSQSPTSSPRTKLKRSKTIDTSSILLEIDPNYPEQKLSGKTELFISTLQQKYQDQINWLLEGHDIVSMEALKTLDEFEVLLDVMLKCRCPIALSLGLNSDNTYTVLYQLLDTFRRDYMIVRVGETHCLFMNPF